MKNSLILLLLLLVVDALPQEKSKWGKAVYQLPHKNNSFQVREYIFECESIDQAAVDLIKNGYWYLFSDLDGDNCPFTPTCSSFYVEAVKETNLLQGTLMFFDRFTRDSNIFDRDLHYAHADKRHFYDPVKNYTLDEEKIIYYFPSTNLNLK